MTPEQALTLLKQVGANFTGNLQDHQKIQEALGVIERLVTAEPKIPIEPLEQREIDNPSEA